MLLPFPQMTLLRVTVFTALLLLRPSLQTSPKRTLFIGGLFGIDTSGGGWNSAGIIPAVRMAFDDINNSSEVLRNYRLELLVKDAKCNIGEAIRSSILYLSNSQPVVMLLGPGCSKAAMPVAESIHHWNLVQIGFSNSSPLLSSKLQFPLYFRTNPSEAFSNLGRIAILKRFNWKRVAILQKNNDVFTGISNSLADLLKQQNITVTAYESFKDHPDIALDNLKKKDARIIFAFFYPGDHYVVFCEAFKKGMFGPKYVWILISGRNAHNWWKVQSPLVTCTPDEVRKGLSNNIGTGELMFSPLPGNTISGQTPQQLWGRYISRLQQEGSAQSENTFAPYGYDAAWTCALTLNASMGILEREGLGLEDFNYSSDHMRGVFVSVMRNTSFHGMTGRVRFNKNFDRITQLEVRQIQVDGNEERRVALYDMESGDYTDNPHISYNWEGGKVPVDGLTISRQEVIVNPALFWTVVALSCFGVVLAVCMLVFNLYYRNVRFIKMSSPYLNNLIIVGSILVYVAGIMFGLDADISGTGCMVWIVTVGFSLAFGAMFSKTWRVHVIFLNAKSIRRVIIKDHQLFGMVAALLLIDFILLITWQIVDPLRETTIDKAMEISEENDIGVIPYVTICSCENLVIWRATMYVYKGLLLLFGAYLAWETRQVHIPALNDSKLIGMSVYNVIIPCVLVIPILGVVEDQPSTKFALTAFLTFFCTTFTICLVFLPKMLFLRKNDGNNVQTAAAAASVVNGGSTAPESSRSRTNETD